MATKPHKDEQVLRELYHERGMTMSEVGEELGVAQSAISTSMSELGIKSRDLSEAISRGKTGTHPWHDEETLRDLYWGEQMTLTEVAEELGASSEGIILKWMDRYGIERRSASVAQTLAQPGAGFVHADARGYETIKHSVGNVTKNYPIHRLVAIAEYGYDAVQDMHVHHKNGIKWDNRPDNIELLPGTDHHKHHDGERERDELGRYT